MIDKNNLTSSSIKKYLKNNGINTSMISITHKYNGCSESFYVTIKDININKKNVETLTNKLEYYERDEVTAEILEGGNTYIFVNYDYDVINEANKKYNDLIVNKLTNELKKESLKNQESWKNCECNPVLKLADQIYCYRDGKSIIILDRINNNQYQSGLTYLADSLIKLGLLNKVIGGVK